MNKFILFASRLSHPEPAPPIIDNNVVETPEPNKALLDLIYGVDKSTGLPCGDIALFINPKSNAEVRNFIELNLMRENSDGVSQVSIPQPVLNKMKSTITDDDIARFSRHDGENREQYAMRIRQYFDSERDRIAAEKRQKNLERDFRRVREKYSIGG